MVFSSKMIDISFMEEFITVNAVKHCSEPDECAGRDDSENESIPGKESLAIDSFNWISGYQTLVAVYVKVEHETIDNGINLEVHTETIEESGKYILSF